MTREEAIKRLKDGAPFSELVDVEWEEALNIAIKALEQEPVLDEIRAEIESEKLEDSPNFCIKAHNNAVDRVLQILDKCKAESEEV